MSIRELAELMLNNPYITPAILAAAAALAGLVGRGALEWWRKVRRQLSAEQQRQVEELAAIAVKFVEQTTEPGTASNAKLRRATGWLAKQCEARGLRVDEDFLQAVIEAAVLGLVQPPAAEPAP